MECLHCGDCCLRFSPIKNPCPLLIKDDDYYFCSDYKNRPEQCSNHRFNGFRFCPVGLNKLQLKKIEQIRIRIDRGWEKIQKI
jgi:Fe-S-cluster containining protein